jgi:hypothetical protein
MVCLRAHLFPSFPVISLRSQKVSGAKLFGRTLGLVRVQLPVGPGRKRQLRQGHPGRPLPGTICGWVALSLQIFNSGDIESLSEPGAKWLLDATEPLH